MTPTTPVSALTPTTPVEDIVNQVISNLDGFDGWNWLHAMGYGHEEHEGAAWAEAYHNDVVARDACLKHACVGHFMSALFDVTFRQAYEAIRAETEGRYGVGFWNDGLMLPLGSEERAAFYEKVRDLLPAIVERLKVRVVEPVVA